MELFNKKKYLQVIAILLLSAIIPTCKTVDINRTLDSREIVKTTKNNPVLAKRSFHQKALTVEGRIAQYSKNSDGHIVLRLGLKHDAQTLKCTLKKSQTFDAPLKHNQKISLKGYSLYSDRQIELVNCIIINLLE